MAYSDFTLAEVVKRFQLTVDETRDLFSPVQPVTPGDLLRAALDETIPLALALQTEKARSEFIIAPILVEVRRLTGRAISLFSGVDFTVDPARGLNGVCDFLISQSREQFFIQAPVMAIIEAKNENIKAGLAQCLAALVAAQIFNTREENHIPTVYGVVTTGNVWRFVQVTGTMVWIDRIEYYVDRVDLLLGIFHQVVGRSPQP